MKKQLSTLLMVALTTASGMALAKESKPAHKADVTQGAVFKDDNAKVSYGIGMDIGKNFKRLALDVDLKVLMQGLHDGYAGNTSQIPNDELSAIMSRYQNELKDKQATAIKNIGAANLKAGEAFLAENAKKQGVVTLPSGLQYKILQVGQGAIPNDDSWVEANYRGTLLDGTEFDSSYRKGKPAVFQVKEATPGWREALKLMPAGSKWQLFVPGKLGYGERGAGREIGPNAALIFEVELLNANAGVGVPAAQGK
jgi:FKBP-type peptidyl-prolyl cis-trans isomerase FklB